MSDEQDFSSCLRRRLSPPQPDEADLYNLFGDEVRSSDAARKGRATDAAPSEPESRPTTDNQVDVTLADASSDDAVSSASDTTASSENDSIASVQLTNATSSPRLARKGTKDAWTPAQEKKLRRGVRRYGKAWKKIIDKDKVSNNPVFTRPGVALPNGCIKNNVDLKDKAYLMKRDYLRCQIDGSPSKHRLVGRWADVSLKKKLQEKLDEYAEAHASRRRRRQLK